MFCSIKALLISYWGPRRLFPLNAARERIFFVEMWPAYVTEFETPDLKRTFEFDFVHLCLYFLEVRESNFCKSFLFDFLTLKSTTL